MSAVAEIPVTSPASSGWLQRLSALDRAQRMRLGVGAALLVAEKDLPHLDAGGMLINLLLDPGTLRTMSQMAHTCARPDAASKVAQGVLALCRQS